jgi:ABC-2 type transport system permease protein
MKYNQFRAMLAITRGSLRAITRSPSAMIFSFIFPFIFIIVFGFIGDSGAMQTYKVYVDFEKPTDSLNNPFYDSLKTRKEIKLVRYASVAEMRSDLEKGRIAAVVHIKKNPNPQVAVPKYFITLESTTSSNDRWPQVLASLENLNNQISNQQFAQRPAYAVVVPEVKEIRQYKTIDFILPGQLGFSLLSAGVFGVAFMFFNLRTTLVLKRFFATPINRTYIILGEGLSRVLFQMMTAVVIILVGYQFFGFTLVHGFTTFLNMMVLSFLGLVVFMGFGFIVSGVAKTDSTIPPFANLITLPQFLLGGSFFSVDAFPTWLQYLAKALPLTHLNEAMRKVAFEGVGLLQVGPEILILLGWGVLVYILAIFVFRWE